MFASKDVFLKSTGGYTISRSVRLRSGASAYFNRTPATQTNRKTWTWSGWTKVSQFGAASNPLFSAVVSGANVTEISFNASNQLDFFSQNTSGTVIGRKTSTAVYRDPSAWYHIVVAIDTSDATASNRIKIYVNGIQITSFAASTDFALNDNTGVNDTTVQRVGARASGTYFFDGYLTEINFIDGQALTPSSFGAISTNGVWQPTAYTGTYGTNGFYLKFADNSTAAALGTDSSGNSNTWTVNNISVTAGVTYDSMTDVPTLTSATAANYAVLNAVLPASVSGTFSNGNLSFSQAIGVSNASATILPTSGKWSWEVQYSAGNFVGVGVAPASRIGLSGGYGGANGIIAMELQSGSIYSNGSVVQSVSSYTTTDVCTVALDLNTGSVQFYKNGSTNGTAVSLTIGSGWTAYIGNGSGAQTATGTINFGQRPFANTAPSGYNALNTQNLSTPTIANGAAYMAATLYTGTGSALSVSNTVNGTSFQPDWVWLKSRNNATNHGLFDVNRGVRDVLSSNTTSAEVVETAGTSLTSFDSSGFSLGTNGSTVTTNVSGYTFVAWQWKANGTGVSNTSGSITSTVSAGTTQGFSVVTYTGTGANATVGHGLGAVPSMIIAKNRSLTGSWSVYHASLGATQYLFLNTTAAAGTGITVWNNTAPTSSVFSIGTDNNANGSGNLEVAYCFAAVAGFSAFGSYTGNGSTDGPFVYLGFRPRFLLIKRTDAIANWRIHDSSRDTYNVTSKSLYPNLSNAETSAASEYWDFLSNGFKLRTSDAESNASAGTYIYMAFAENPFRYALAF